MQAAQRGMLRGNRPDRKALLGEAAAHVSEGTVERLVVAEVVISLRLPIARRRRKPFPSRLDAARDKSGDRPLAGGVLRWAMHKRQEEMRLDGAQPPRIDVEAASARCGDARDLTRDCIDVGDMLE